MNDKWEVKAKSRDRKRNKRSGQTMLVAGRSTKTVLLPVIAKKAEEAKRRLTDDELDAYLRSERDPEDMVISY